MQQPVRLGAPLTCIFAAVASMLLASLVFSPVAAAQSVETPQQTNDRIRNLSSSLAANARLAPPRDYIIGSGDLVSVQVFDVPELSRDLRVSQTGSIGLPLIPVRLHVAGLTEAQTEIKIEEILEANGLVSHPQVSVSVRERKSKPITIVGAVAHPMVYQADRQISLIEIIAEAGGIANDAGDSVIVTRQETPVSDPSEPPSLGSEDPVPPPGPAANAPAGDLLAQKPAVPSPAAGETKPAEAPLPVAPPSNTITINLNQILEAGDVRNNIILQPGDIVTVPHAGIIYVLGAVSRPGGFVVSNDRSQLSTLKVLALAGGLNHTAKSDHAVIIRKDSTGQQHEVPVDLRKVMKRESEDVQLLPSDVLYVPNSTAKVALFRAGELGLGLATGILIYRVVP